MKILICGDSFAADWTVKFNKKGWPNMLADEFDVTNLAQAGCGQYKIYQQVCSSNMESFDKIIIAHTSPYRIHVQTHPLHHDDLLHHSCDLIYSDIVASKKLSLLPLKIFFEKYYDLEYARFVHILICQQIDKILEPFKKKVINLINFNYDDLYQFQNICNCEDVFKNHRGFINHFSDEGNLIVFNRLKLLI